jgi:hypothetical protein
MGRGQGTKIRSAPVALRGQRSSEEVLNWYQSDGYEDVNYLLRSNRPLGKHTASVAALDRMISESLTSQPLSLYRGCTVYDDHGNKWLKTPLEDGDVIEDACFLSASPNKDVAENFAKEIPGSPGVLFQIQVPNGTHALACDNILEEEMLLPRNTKLKVEAVSTDETGLLQVIVSVV